ncbi:MAG: N-formylglutamate amidohydrolase [Sphingomonadaceae bacterium]|uniref:N-formylglutamate amidohydrolase n=1 Tax=Thermaurantiacus sp. TaxID=2820283 RepID=UPI00298F2FBB|nr:N-formylglutamate amidohydrolase [Thermaurantiacus sp.]MCS6986320.1 N-formylglutamate amidohydrolase [Sphingomonadaceae bacterium]MDW8414418.1 N-formylglutamate amidohydrolase [Thermaurantiacus sp.]
MTPFRLSAPLDGWSPVLLASAHSGTFIPASARRRLKVPDRAVRRLEDPLVGRLLERAARHAPLIEATHARAVIDLNRAECDFDAAAVAGGPRAASSDRGRAGFGLFPRIVGPGEPLLAGPWPRAEAEARIARLHRPWHAALAAGLAAARARHGVALLLDVHSMPPLGPGGPEVVLGDRHGTSADPMIVARVDALFRAAGFKVARNHPYAGGHALERHGRPKAKVHAVQVELCRALYLDLERLVPNAAFAALAEALDGIVAALVGELGGGLALAAAE